MPRYYRRHYTKVVAKKSKWAAHLFNFNSQTNNDWLAIQLCKNSDETQIPISSIIKTGNFKVNVGLTLNRNQETRGGFALTGCVMYLPEGQEVNSGDDINNIMMRHPEWVMAIKYKSFQPADEQTSVQSNLEVSSRLKRNLNTGDGIYLLIQTPAANLNSIGVQGVVRFWTRFN